MESKSTGFWGNTSVPYYTCTNDQAIKDEASMSSSSPSHEHIAFESTPNVQIYLENEDEFLFTDDLIQLAYDLNIPNKTKIKINGTLHTLLKTNNELYITGINEIADAYYRGMQNNPRDVVYINCSEYSHVLKRIATLSAKARWQNLLLAGQNNSEESLDVQRDTNDRKLQLFHTLSNHQCMTNEEIVKIISSKNWDIRSWTSLNYHSLVQIMGKERAQEFLRLLETKTS